MLLFKFKFKFYFNSISIKLYTQKNKIFYKTITFSPSKGKQAQCFRVFHGGTPKFNAFAPWDLPGFPPNVVNK